MTICTYAGCDRPHFARGFCNKHYARLKRTGTADLITRPKPACLAALCDKAAYSNGLCSAHYNRLRTTGRLEGPTIAERILASYRVDEETGCWLWQMRPGANGYGRISIGDELVYAHRASYQLFIGPIPAGLHIDHLCRVQICINPAHLEPVTAAENTRREMAARSSTS